MKVLHETTDEVLTRFVAESNRIEGILREPTAAELEASRNFLGAPMVTIEGLKEFVRACEPGARLRDAHGMNVRVGMHMPPIGGPGVYYSLERLLRRVFEGDNAYEVHVAYERLHPFMDCNGRSGRILWAWQMVRQPWPNWGLRLGFLHAWYYQSLEASQ